MLDTDIARYIIKGRSPEIEAKLSVIEPSIVCVSVITRAELLYGLKRLPSVGSFQGQIAGSGLKTLGATVHISSHLAACAGVLRTTGCRLSAGYHLHYGGWFFLDSEFPGPRKTLAFIMPHVGCVVSD